MTTYPVKCYPVEGRVVAHVIGMRMPIAERISKGHRVGFENLGPLLGIKLSDGTYCLAEVTSRKGTRINPIGTYVVAEVTTGDDPVILRVYQKTSQRANSPVISDKVHKPAKNILPFLDTRELYGFDEHGKLVSLEALPCGIRDIDYESDRTPQYRRPAEEWGDPMPRKEKPRRRNRWSDFTLPEMRV